MQNAMNGGVGSATPQLIYRTKPIVIAAAGAVLVFSLLGIAAVTGMLPNAISQKPSDAVAATKHQGARPEARIATTKSEARIATAAVCANCGSVESVRTVEVKGSGSGLGSVAGGLTGAAVGSQLGRGNGNTAMIILGAAGGALAGNEIEKNMKKQVTYRVTVRMDDGSYRTVSQSNPVNVGEKVRVVNGAIVARS